MLRALCFSRVSQQLIGCVSCKYPKSKKIRIFYIIIYTAYSSTLHLKYIDFGITITAKQKNFHIS